jgi:hypothetical protein
LSRRRRRAVRWPMVEDLVLRHEFRPACGHAGRR